MTRTTAVTYHRLTPAARDTIRWDRPWDVDFTIAAFVRHYFPDGQWRGDRCGCVDDRCIGHHHDENEECGCLRASLDDLAIGL